MSCLAMVENAAVPARRNMLGMGDVFLAEDGLYFVPYVIYERTGFGGGALAGAAMGGIPGLLVGTLLDEVKGGAKKVLSEDAPKTSDDAKRLSAVQRDKDFGLSLRDRVSTRGGAFVLRKDIRSIGVDGSWCHLLPADGEKVQFKFLAMDEPKLATVLNSWHAGQLTTPQSTIEGAEVGVTVPDALKMLEAGGLTDDAMNRMAADGEYATRFTKAFLRSSVSTGQPRLTSAFVAAIGKAQGQRIAAYNFNLCASVASGLGFLGFTWLFSQPLDVARSVPNAQSDIDIFWWVSLIVVVGSVVNFLINGLLRRAAVRRMSRIETMKAN